MTCIDLTQRWALAAGLMVALLSAIVPPAAGQHTPPYKLVVFLAGNPSHGYGSHEHFAGATLLAHNLMMGQPEFEVRVFRNEWPSDPQWLKRADAIVIYSDGGEGHPAIPHLKELDAQAQRGAGIVCIHYAVEVPKGEAGDRFLDWIGGYFETDWSVNPHWKADFRELPEHPITRGVKPFAIQDEWYYHMRFRPELQGVTPILTAIPPAETLARPDGPHSGNPHVRAKAGQPQHVAWAAERPGGGRGFGFTGGHYHWNWGDDNFRRLMLNAIVWTAHFDVPEEGVGGIERLTVAELQRNQDEPVPEPFDAAKVAAEFNLDGGGR